MMIRQMGILMALLLIFGLSGCEMLMDHSKKGNEYSNNALDELNEGTDPSKDAFSLVSTSEDSSVTVTNDNNATESAQQEALTNGYGITLDETLTGQALVDSMMVKVPSNYIMVSESDMGEMGGVTISTTYMTESYYRMETESEYGHQIMIYNADERATYSYTVGDSVGYVFYDSPSLEMEIGADIDSISDWTPIDENVIKAEITKLNGEEVVYMETEYTDAGYTSLTYSWTSIEYGLPLKYEYYSDGMLAMTSEVTDLKVNYAIDLDLFKRPENIDFQETDYDY